MISEANKVRGRHHLGYGNVQSSATFVLGVPAAVQTAFMIEGAWSRILPQAEEMFVQHLDRLDAVEAQIDEDMENVAVNKLGTIELREDEFKQLIIRYKHFQGALANMLQVPPNPFDFRPWLGGGYSGSSGINVPVSG